jgi:hypothetical protein
MPTKKYLLSFKEIVVLSLVSIFILFTPYLLSRGTSYFSLNDEGLARIGTALSITAPFIGILGSVLVYIAFKVQYRANQDIKSQFQQQSNDEMFFRLFDSAKNHFTPALTDNAEQFVNMLAQNQATYGKMMLLEDPTIVDIIDLTESFNEIVTRTGLVRNQEETEETFKGWQ